MSQSTTTPSTPAPTTSAPAAPSRPRTWLRRINSGGQIIETCPTFRDGTTWCTDGHENDDTGCLDDLTHGSEPVSFQLPPEMESGEFRNLPALSAQIVVDPYEEDPARNVPHVEFSPSMEDTVDLNPEQLAAVISGLRAYCDDLGEVHARLVAARAEYGAR